ncbi:head maturation protease, ClpP-related [Clostridium sp. 1001275B_160808_H3]|uniref:head maturation protease, ClpP-related n=1 Tax=Clostridium sp. 1001275B_160808_H3 TaxID=2787110 RepID=UPI00189BC413|nr:head maturation protease, ClpP-related [Clostridium sp. 1001275B_160808_H3]
MDKKYWEFKNQSSTEADLYLYIEVASWGAGYAAHSAQSFKQELDDLGEISTLNIYINSPGGDVFEGNTIMNMLKRKKCTKNVYIDGLAASIASVIAMAGDKIIMPSNAMMMIHNAWTYAAGNSNELRKLADDLDKVNASIRQTYLDKAGEKLDEETLITLMDNETWLTAQECYYYGLCDIVGEDTNIAAKFDLNILNKYRNIPVNYVLSQAENKNNNHEEINNLENEKKAILEELELI